MKKLIFLSVLSTNILASCVNQKKNTEDSSSVDGQVAVDSSVVKVEFVGSSKNVIKNNQGKATLYAIPEHLADVAATEIASTTFESSAFPFTVNFHLPNNHKSMIQPAVKETDVIKYYVDLDWDSDGNGTVDSADVAIDFDKEFPNVDIKKEVNKVNIK